MNNNYFTLESELRKIFIQVPKQLMNRHSKYFKLSAEAKLMYGIFLDRMNLSLENNWVDSEGRIYFIYSVENQMIDFDCGNQKVIKLNKELIKFGLLEKKNRGQGKAALFYLKQIDVEENLPNQSYQQKCENHISKNVEITSQEMLKSHGNNTNINNTNNNKNSIYLSNDEKNNDKDRLIDIEKNKKIEIDKMINECANQINEKYIGTFKSYECKKLARVSICDIDIIEYAYDKTIEEVEKGIQLNSLCSYMVKIIENELKQ